MEAILSLPNIRIRSSSRLAKNWVLPGSPCLPERPRNCLSTRRLSCRSVPTMASPPASLTPGPSLISVPRPAILVAMVTAPVKPASATTCASLACCFAFNTLCGMFFCFNILLSNSLISTEVVPTSEGRPARRSFSISSITALYFSRLVLYTKSCSSLRMAGKLVGIVTTSNL